MAVYKLSPQSLALFLSQNQRYINTLIVVLLALYLLALAADLVWKIIPEPAPPSQNLTKSVVSSSIKRSNQGVDVRALQRLNLFGRANQPPKPKAQEDVTDAPETRLNLVLAGVVSSNLPENGAAIIENRGSQSTYGIGEKIEGTRATLSQVQVDRVIIRNAGRNETLMLEGINYEQANQNRARVRAEQARRQSPAARTNKSSQTPRLSKEAVQATQQLRGKPDSFIDFISIAPHRENNQMMGYRVSPGKDPSLFNAVGLQKGDIINQINGLDVTEPSQAIEALDVLRNAEVIELMLSRKGEIVTVFLELPAQAGD